MFYYLMRKDEKVMMVSLTNTGSLSKTGAIFNKDLIPLQDRISHTSPASWWSDRKIPIKQGKIDDMLRQKGILGSEEYLFMNLGLSLTDYYWIKPINSPLEWKDVNLYDNDFKENLLLGSIENKRDNIIEYSPNSSLQGNIEKTWIIDNGKRCLIKGNHDQLSSESINEVIISNAYEKQKIPTVVYSLIRIKGKEYKYGCISEAFTSKEEELVSAYAVITSEIKRNDISVYEHFINVCEKNGLDRDYVRKTLESQILMDFAFGNRDRHLTNIAVLRDADSLRFTRLAPSFDSGKSLGVLKDIVKINPKNLIYEEVNGFKRKAIDHLKLVKDTNLIDLNLLPSKNVIKTNYLMDPYITKERVDFVLEYYERKVDILDNYIHNRPLLSTKFFIADMEDDDKSNDGSDLEDT